MILHFRPILYSFAMRVPALIDCQPIRTKVHHLRRQSQVSRSTIIASRPANSERSYGISTRSQHGSGKACMLAVTDDCEMLCWAYQGKRGSRPKRNVFPQSERICVERILTRLRPVCSHNIVKSYEVWLSGLACSPAAACRRPPSFIIESSGVRQAAHMSHIAIADSQVWLQHTRG